MTNPLLLQQRHLHKGVFFVHNDTYTITVGINHYILGGKRSHGISYIHHRPTISLLQVQVRITLAHHHVIGILWLTEHIHQSPQKGQDDNHAGGQTNATRHLLYAPEEICRTDQP